MWALIVDGSINKNVGVGGTDLFVVNTSKFLRQAEFSGGINIGNNLGIGVSSATNKVHIQTSDDVTALLESTNPGSVIAFKDNNTAAALLFTIIASSAPVIDEMIFAK